MNNTKNTWGKKVIEKALEYANYKWIASERNVMHGVDIEGRYVDTPDVTRKGENLDCGWWKVNEINIGIPYSWGNASTLEEFEKGIPIYATVIDDLAEIQQGDVFAKVGSHVMFFKEFVNSDKTKVIIIDSTRSTGKVSQRQVTLDELFAKGYKIYRKN